VSDIFTDYRWSSQADTPPPIIDLRRDVMNSLPTLRQDSSDSRMEAMDTRALSQIRPGLFITDRVTGRDHALLVAHGIGAVLCLDRAEFPFDIDPDDLPLAVHLRHLNPGTNSVLDFEQAVAALGELVAAHGRVVVHCHHGQGRSVAVVATYLADAEGIEPQIALDEVTSLRGAAGAVPRSLIRLVCHRGTGLR